MANDHRQIAARLAALARPERRALDRAAGLWVLADVLWLPQAAALAWALASLASGGVSGAGLAGGSVSGDGLSAGGLALAALGVGGIGLVRALLGWAASALAETSADRVIAAARSQTLTRAERRAPEAGAPASAATAVLIVEKLAMLRPWLVRWRPAQMRVLVVPLLIMATALPLSWAVALILLVAGPLIPVFMALIGMAARDASDRQLDEMANLNALLVERLQALVDIRLLRATPVVLADFATRADTLRARTMAVLRIAFLSSAVLELFAALGVAMVAVYVGFSLLGAIDFGGWGGSLGLGQGIFLLLLAPAYFQPLRDMAAAWHDRAAGQSVARDLIADEGAALPQILGAGGSAAPVPGPPVLRVRGLHLRGRTMPDLTLAPGEALALTGPSGSGKTSMLMAIAGLLPSDGAVQAGPATLDADTADGWRAGLALIPQEVHFLDASLRDNLTMGAERGADQIEGALALAQAAPVVARLPQGLATILGERGAGVSGGEARRLMIARAALRAPTLILADEPTADLDDETAAAVIAGLLALNARGAALICATHDPRLIAALPRRIEIPG